MLVHQVVQMGNKKAGIAPASYLKNIGLIVFLQINVRLRRDNIKVFPDR